MTSIKYLDSGEIAGWGAPFGDPAHKDAHGEFFSARTDFQLNLIPNARPVLIGHGLTGAGPVVVGRITGAEKRDRGLWVTAVLDRASTHFERIKAALAKGLLSFSSGTMAHLARVGAGGEILSWPLIEVSLTQSPASQDARIVSVREAVAHYAAIGQPQTALKAVVFGARAPIEPSPEELAYADALKEAARVEGMAAFMEYRQIAAKMDRRLGQIRSR
jgi:hypothetical protein